MSRLDQLTTLHAADPADADVPYMIAQEHAKAGDLDAAVEWYDRCLAIDAEYHYAYFHKARALESAEKQAEARETLTVGLGRARAAGNAKATNEIAEYLAHLGGES
ncbi:MAG: hypothetical protein AAGI30_09920 [Planctomycetota bacterium]